MTKKSPQIKYIGIITSVYSVRKMGSASLYRNSRKDSSVSETPVFVAIVWVPRLVCVRYLERETLTSS